MKNYKSWSNEQLEQEEKELRMMGYHEDPDICEIDIRNNLQMVRKMHEGHAEWLAVCSELQSRQNEET